VLNINDTPNLGDQVSAFVEDYAESCVCSDERVGESIPHSGEPKQKSTATAASWPTAGGAAAASASRFDGNSLSCK